jgi:protein-tyrosine phosphatase
MSGRVRAGRWRFPVLGRSWRGEYDCEYDREFDWDIDCENELVDAAGVVWWRNGNFVESGEWRVVSVLFVCTGNICRSPTAEGVFRALVEAGDLAERITIDSAGTGAWHAGEPPDARAQEAALRRGYDLSDQRARQVRADDFARFDLVLAMDRGHRDHLGRLCPAGQDHRLRLFLEYAPTLGVLDVPDPYYGPGDGFERVLDTIEAGAAGLLDAIRADHL